MIKGGVATIYVTDMDRAVRFYSEALGLRLLGQQGGHWASLDAGDGLVLGLHSVPADDPRIGQTGAITVGLSVSGAIESEVTTFLGRGVKFRGPVQVDGQARVKMAFFTDPDGNPLYLCDAGKNW
jgi:catechol 2,3-dioxygenase-like lactoylglutathione lyase family enzyme